MDHLKKLSFVIPVYNEEENIVPLYIELKGLIQKELSLYNYEILYIDDGSRDMTWEKIQDLSKKDARIRGVSLSRNFGHQNALLAGYSHANGDAIISLDGDGQHPIATIPTFVAKWEDGYEIISARAIEGDIGFFKKYTARLYYTLMRSMADTPVLQGVGDFRLIDNKVLKEFLHINETDLYLRGTFSWMGYRHALVDYHIEKRWSGKSKYSWGTMFRLAKSGALNLSVFPISLGLIIGSLMMIGSLTGLLVILYTYLMHGTTYKLWIWGMIGLVFIIGLQFVFLWILAEYMRRVYHHDQARPHFIVSRRTDN